MTGKAGLAPLPVEGQIPLPLLPRTEAVGAEEDGDGAAGGERLLQRLRPRLPGGEIPAVEEDADAVLAESARDALDGGMVVVA